MKEALANWGRFLTGTCAAAEAAANKQLEKMQILNKEFIDSSFLLLHYRIEKQELRYKGLWA